MASLPEPVVSPDVYGETYFQTANWGFEEWVASEGRSISPIYAGILTKARFTAGERLVDLGTGRGEMLVAAVAAGAADAVGAEYSAAAVRLAEQTLAVNEVGDRARVVLCDARQTPLPDAEADLVTMADVVEHLSPDELDAALREALRLVRPGGRIVVHTMPNRLVYTVTYRLQRLLRPDRWGRWPADPRVDYERSMHVNEQSPRRLRRALRRAGWSSVEVRLGAFVHDSFVPDQRARRTIAWLARHRWTAVLGAGDIWGEARRPG